MPFAKRQIRVLGPVELVLFNALFDRPQDWVAIATVVEARAVAPDRVRQGLLALVEADDARLAERDASTR